jgi:hypothetical protein
MTAITVIDRDGGEVWRYSPWLQRCRWTGELVHVVGSAHHRKRVVGQVIVVVPQPVVGIEECLHMPPRAPDRVRMSERRRT